MRNWRVARSRLCRGVLLPVVAFSALLPAVTARVWTRAATQQEYVVRALNMPHEGLSGDARGINGHGMVVGFTEASATTMSEIWHLNPAGKEVKRQDVSPPAGYSGTTLIAVNEKSVAAGNVMTASDEAGVYNTYPAGFRMGIWTVLQGKNGRSIQGQAEGIADGGEIIATVSHSHGTSYRAAIFNPTRNGYSHAHILPLSRGASSSQAGTISSVGTTVVVGGSEVVDLPGGQEKMRAVIWVDGRGPFQVRAPSPWGSPLSQSITGLYSAGDSWFVVIGTSSFEAGGIPETDSFVNRIRVSGRRPFIGQSSDLPTTILAPYGYADAIGGDGSAGADTFTIAGDAADGTGLGSAAIWAGSISEGKIAVAAPSMMSQTAWGDNPDCAMYRIEALDTEGDGAGFAFCGGEARPDVVLAPDGSARSVGP